MSVKAEQIYVNLPVKDLDKSIDFFKSLGFEFDQQFTDEKAACLVLGDNIFAMLLVESFFQRFTNKEIPDTRSSSEVIVALSAASRDTVNDIINKAAAAGGEPVGRPVDHGWMYTWSFRDLDGHIWEFLHADTAAIAQG